MFTQRFSLTFSHTSSRARRFALVSLVAPACGLLTACAGADAPPARPTAVQQLELAGGSPLALTLRAAGNAQEGVAGDSGDVRLITALRTDSEAESRLCGVIVARSRSMEALPFAWPVDSTLPYLVPQLVNGADVQGYRVIVPGVNSEYRFEGFTTDGSTRVSLRWPVRAERSLAGDASDYDIQAALMPSPHALDSLVMQLRRRAPLTEGQWRGHVPASTELGSERAVKFAPLLPLFPVGFTAPCGEATFKVALSKGAERPMRILARKGETVSVVATTPSGELSLYFEEAGPDKASTGRNVKASAKATADGHVTLKLRYAPGDADPDRQQVLVRLTSVLPQ
ncbi:hypothetical protein [Gemmatimonas sp.]